MTCVARPQSQANKHTTIAITGIQVAEISDLESRAMLRVTLYMYMFGVSQLRRIEGYILRNVFNHNIAGDHVHRFCFI